jgi:Immunity protein 26
MSNKYAEVGPIQIWFPDTSSAEFSILHDLAELFGLALQHEAVKKLEQQLATLNLQPRPVIDYEADSTHIMSKSPTTILAVAEAITTLSEPPNSVISHGFSRDSLLKRLTAWKRPRPQDWRTGDVFAIPLKDGRFSFGQVVGIMVEYRAPICAWFALSKASPFVTEEELIDATLLTIFNGSGVELNDGAFDVVANIEVLADPSRAKKGTSISEGFLVGFAEAWFGLSPWNVLYPGYYDRCLLPGRTRPPGAIVLSEGDRHEYRRRYFNLDENNQRIEQVSQTNWTT